MRAREIDLTNMTDNTMTRALDLAHEGLDFAQHLTHVSRLVTLGEMAAGVVHELNQPLNPVQLPGRRDLHRRPPVRSTEFFMAKNKERKATVFIVDDDEAVRRSLQLLLKTLELSSTVCASA